MPNITVPQKNKVLEVPLGQNLMDALIEAGLPVASSCLGEGICSKCAVVCDPCGTHNELEKRTLQKNNLSLDHRLCCQVQVVENLSVKTSYW